MIIYLYTKSFGDFGGGAKSSRTTFEYLKKENCVEQFSYVKDLKKNIKIKKPDVVLHHNREDLIKVFKVCKKFKIPLIVTVNGLWGCGKGTNIKKKYDECFKCSLNGIIRCSLESEENVLKKIKSVLESPLRYYIIKKRLKILNGVSGLIAIGQTLKKILEINGVKREIYISPQPIDDSFLIKPDILKKKNKKNKKKKILFNCSWDSTKGFILLLEAFNKLKRNDAELLIIGRKINVSEKEIRPYINDKIKFIEKVPLDIMKNYYYSSDIFVFPSLIFEPFGRSWAEAALAGLPIISFKGRGGASDYLNKENSYLIDVDADKLAEAMNKLLDDEKLRKKIGENARTYAKNNLAASVVVPRLIKIYREVIK